MLSQELSSEEREWLTLFFNDIMLFESGIYTLWGAQKPVTTIPVANYSEKDMKARYEALSEAEKNKASFSVDIVEGYSLAEAWKKWEQISPRFPMKRFMLFKQEKQDPHFFFIIFVDIVKTAAVIQDNYEAFQKAMGFDFHPLELVQQIDQKDSVFWKNLNSHLYGLLFGFGKTNSQIFHWKHFDHPKSCDELCKIIKPSFSNKQLTGNVKFSINNFQIPDFVSFNNIDPVIKNYEEEMKMIRKIYEGHDFLELTLQKLTE